MTTFRVRLRELREEKGLNQEDMAKELSRFAGETISRSRLASYEQGRRQPDLEFLELIADYFNIELDYLLGRQDHKRGYYYNIKSKEVAEEAYKKHQILFNASRDVSPEDLKLALELITKAKENKGD